MSILNALFGWNFCSLLLELTMALVIVAILYYCYPILFPKLKGYPGPSVVPVFGTLLGSLKHGMGNEDLKNIKKYGRVFKTVEGRTEGLLIADPEILRQVLVKEFSSFSNHQKFPLSEGLSLFEARDEHWHWMRRLLTPAFTSGKLKKMLPIINDCVKQLIINLEPKGRTYEKIELKETFGPYILDISASTTFGVELDSQKDPNNPFVIYSKKIFNVGLTSPVAVIVFFFPFLVPLLKKMGVTFDDKASIEFFSNVISKAIQEKQQQELKRADLLQMMMDADISELDDEANEDMKDLKMDPQQTHKGLTSKQIVYQATLFLSAGYDTAANTMAFFMYNMAMHPEVQDKVYDEITQVMQDYKEVSYEALSKMTYMDQCINETLRMYPPFIRADRLSGKNNSIGEITIPKDTVINIPIYALHHDPEFYPDPEKFDPERFNKEEKNRTPFVFLPFGAGPRQCIGTRLVFMEVKQAFVKLMQKFRFRDAGVPLDIDTTFIIKSKSGIWVIPELR